MKYKVLIIRNSGIPDIARHLASYKAWLEVKTPLEVQFDYLDVSLNINYKLFTHILGRQYYGLADLKEQLRDRVDIVNGYYQEIIFVYEPEGFNLGNQGVLCGWTYPSDLFGSPLCEVFVDPVLYDTSNFVVQLCHETVHAMHRRLWFQGIATVDDMDVYDKNDQLYALDGNYQRNLNRLGIWWNRIAEPVSFLTLTRLKQVLKIAMDKFDALSKFNNALIKVESSGNDYAIGDTNLEKKAYGPLQIRQPYVDDVNATFGTKHRAEDCLGNRKLSIDIKDKYMSIYATEKRLGRPVTDEDRARIHNGGPNGWKNDGTKLAIATKAYWERVKKYL